MVDNFDIKYLKPFKGNHSISEVIFSVYLASPIINSIRYEALVKEGGALYNNFQNFKPLTGIRVNMKITPNVEKSSESGIFKTGNDGFNIEKYKDGKLSWLIGYQPSNPPIPGQDLLKIHCTDYVSWTSFFSEVVNLLTIISNFEDLFIRGYSLLYLDQFYWMPKELPDMSNIFEKGNLYLSNLFLETEGIWGFASNTNRSIKGKMVSENISIGIKDNFTNEGSYLIYIFHNSSTMIDEFKSLKELVHEEELETVANEMHSLNKNFLKLIFSTQVQTLIGL